MVFYKRIPRGNEIRTAILSPTANLIQFPYLYRNPESDLYFSKF